MKSKIYEVVKPYTNRVKKVSRWIKIKIDYITPRHGLWDYAMNNDGVLDYFEFHGKKYAIGQFLSLSIPMEYTDGNHEVLGYLSAYDSTEYYNPLLLEIDEGCEYIRLWEEVRE